MSYWEERWAADAARAYRAAEDVVADIERLHHRATVRLQTMAKRIRRRFQVEYGLTEAEAKALLASPIGREEYLAMLAEIRNLGEKNPMREALMAKAAAPGYAYRVSVIEGMLNEVDAVTARLAEDEQRLLDEHLGKTLKEKASRAAYQIQVEAGMGFRFNAVSEELARVILKNPWSGMVFSARIWKNQDALAETLNEVLAEGLAAGNSGEEMAREIAERMGVSMSRARTLVRTETTYVCNQADAYAYEEAEIGSYRYVAVLDAATSRVCRRLDGSVHAVQDAVPGKNYPPMHPNCRSTTRPDISEDDLRRMERWSRDPVTGEGVKVSADMTYDEWLKLQEETYGEERIKAAQKMADNKAKDKRQFKEYQNLLGKKHMPKDLASFQEMKYTEPDEWARMKRAAATIREVDAKPWSDAFKKRAKNTYWTMRSEDVEMSGHALARYLNRRDDVPGGCTTDQLAEICKKPANYRQADGRDVNLYNGVAAIFSEKTGEMVSFVVREKPKKEWEVL